MMKKKCENNFLLTEFVFIKSSKMFIMRYKSREADADLSNYELLIAEKIVAKTKVKNNSCFVSKTS